MLTTALYCNNSSVPVLQESADIITDWSRNNDMLINATKTKEMVMSQSTYCTVYRVVFIFIFIVFTLTGPHCKTVFY